MQAPYIDDGGLRPQDEIGLQSFLATRDRAKLFPRRGVPFFSGREPEINAFRRTMGDLEHGFAADATYVVEGPPGAGKTALMAQCIGEAAQRPPTPGGREWLPVVVHAAITPSAEALGRTIDRAIAERLAAPEMRTRRDLLIAEVRERAERAPSAQRAAARQAADLLGEATEQIEAEPRETRGDAFDRIADRARDLLASAAGARAQAAVRSILKRGFSITGFSVGAAQGTSHSSIADEASARAGQWSAYQIVLFIDEGQNIPARNPDGGRASCLSMIHEGAAGAPLSLCVFGLPGTADALRSVGISRTVAERWIPLGPLDQTACRQAVNRCFAHFRVVSGDGWKEAIVACSNGWPQHLAGYLIATLGELESHPAPSGGYDAAKASLASAIAAGDRSRWQYYEQRAASLARHGQLELARALVSELRASGGMGGTQIDQVLSSAEPRVTRDEVGRFIQAAIHCGFLEHDPRQGIYRMPIPSFGAFLLNEAPERGEEWSAEADDSSGLPATSAGSGDGGT